MVRLVSLYVVLLKVAEPTYLLHWVKTYCIVNRRAIKTFCLFFDKLVN